MKTPTDLSVVPFEEVRAGRYYYSRIDGQYGQLVGIHYADGATGFFEVFDLEDGDTTDEILLVDLGRLFQNTDTVQLNKE